MRMKTVCSICATAILLLALFSLPTCTDSLIQSHPAFRTSSSSRLHVVNPQRRRILERISQEEEDDGTSTTRITRRKALSTDSVLESLSALSFPPRNANNNAQSKAEERKMLLQQQRVPPTDNGIPKKYVMLGLIWFVSFLSALDRVAMSVALLPMATEFDFTDSMKGSISSLFSVGYGLAILPAGLLVANLSPRQVMAIGLAVWSLATIATPMAVGLGAGAGGDISVGPTMAALLAARALVGAGESVILPTIQRLMSTWTTAEEKGTSLAAIFTGFQAGTVAAYLLSPVVMDALGGWRGLFYCYGAIGLATLVPWLLLAQDRPAADGTAERQLQQQGAMAFQPFTRAPKAIVPSEETWEGAMEGAMTTVRTAPWAGFLQSKGTIACLLAHCAKNWSLYIALAWTPTFYAEQYGIGLKDSAWLSVLPSIAGAACGLVAGSAADAVLQNLDAVVTDDTKCSVRKGFQSFAFLGQSVALGSLALHIPDDPVVAQAFLMAAFGLMGFNSAGFEAGIQDKAGEKWAGLMYSFTSLPAVMAGTLGVYCTGLLLDTTNQDWSVIFGLNAAVNALGALAFLTLYDSKREFD